MYRGSSFLLQKSAVTLIPVIEYIASLDKSAWEIDVDKYSDANINYILEIYTEIKVRLIENNNKHVTLISKIMLGVFGNIPAYDQFFMKTFKGIFKNSTSQCAFTTVNKKSLNCIKLFYEDNKVKIDKYASEMKTLGFKSAYETVIQYPKAKIIDMYGFNKGIMQTY